MTEYEILSLAINIAILILKKTIKVYNFEVEDAHTYFVSGLELLVHNSCGKNTKHGEYRAKQGRNGDPNRNVGDTNKIKWKTLS